MAVPDFQSVMLPLLELASDGQEHVVAEAVDRLAEHFDLSDEDRREMLPSGTQRRFDNRVAWSRSYLKQAHLLEYPGRGKFRLTERGRQVLNEKPDRINIPFLMRFPEFAEFRSSSQQPKFRRSLPSQMMPSTSRLLKKPSNQPIRA